MIQSTHQLKKAAIVAVTTLFLFSSLDAHAYYKFGVDGSWGQSGLSGQSGRSGRDTTIVADGSAKSFDLSGGDATPASPGYDGQDAWSCYQNYGVDYDVEGANGGRGGSGGSGGIGGSGGNITVYYANASHLKSIFVRSTPGRGTNGAHGGRGGYPCRCTMYSWQVQHCQDITRPDGSHEHVCRYETHYCHDGAYGMNGYNGIAGVDGSYGRIILIPQTAPLQEDVDSIDMSIGEAMRGTVLAANTWEDRSGAETLFAPGSDIRSDYSYFTGRHSFPVSFSWSCRRSIQDFINSELHLSLVDSYVDFSSAPNIWIESSRTVSGAQTSFDIKKIVRTSETTQLSASIRGNGKNTELVINDQAGVSDLLTSAIDLKLEHDAWFGKNLFEGSVPANLMEVKPGEISIKVGLMNIADKYLRSGTPLKAKLSVKRSLQRNSATWDNNWKGKIN